MVQGGRPRDHDHAGMARRPCVVIGNQQSGFQVLAIEPVAPGRFLARRGVAWPKWELHRTNCKPRPCNGGRKQTGKPRKPTALSLSKGTPATRVSIGPA